MGKVILEGLEFYAYHGYYEEERKLGARYGIDIEVETCFSEQALNDELSGTVNYEVLYNIASEAMKKPTKLLEALGKRIIDDIENELGKQDHITVKVSKFDPPLGGVCKKATVIISSQE